MALSWASVSESALVLRTYRSPYVPLGVHSVLLVLQIDCLSLRRRRRRLSIVRLLAIRVGSLAAPLRWTRADFLVSLGDC
jgi:hypothetical protein